MRGGLTPFLAVAALAVTACGGSDAPGPDAAPTLATLSGTVTYRERMPMRLNSVIKVRLEDVSRADAPARAGCGFVVASGD